LLAQKQTNQLTQCAVNSAWNRYPFQLHYFCRELIIPGCLRCANLTSDQLCLQLCRSATRIQCISWKKPCTGVSTFKMSFTEKHAVCNKTGVIFILHDNLQNVIQMFNVSSILVTIICTTLYKQISV